MEWNDELLAIREELKDEMEDRIAGLSVYKRSDMLVTAYDMAFTSAQALAFAELAKTLDDGYENTLVFEQTIRRIKPRDQLELAVCEMERQRRVAQS